MFMAWYLVKHRENFKFASHFRMFALLYGFERWSLTSGKV